jgi:trehalose 6-phosphate phosphatase
MHPGRGVLEVRLPGFDKGTALRRLVERDSPRVVVFAGDDRGDLPGMLAVRDLRRQGLIAFAVGAGAAEVPELAAAADVLVDGPAGMLELLRGLTHSTH